MKFFRFGAAGNERPGVVGRDGVLRDASGLTEDVSPSSPSFARLCKLSQEEILEMPPVPTGVRLGVPFVGTTKIVAIGLNYVDHAREANLPIPVEPIIFLKPTTSICGPNDDTVMPAGATKLDWEVELAVVIGAKAKCVGKDRALDYVAGYCLANDVSERAFQLERGGTWDKGKGCDTFAPLGPYLVTKDEFPDVHRLGMRLEVNGVRMQDSNTSNMIFDCAHLVSYVSHFITLLPGDVILTGTPPGVGMGLKPPRFLSVGDVVTLSIDALGSQCQEVVLATEVDET